MIQIGIYLWQNMLSRMGNLMKRWLVRCQRRAVSSICDQSAYLSLHMRKNLAMLNPLMGHVPIGHGIVFAHMYAQINTFTNFKEIISVSFNFSIYFLKIWWITPNRHVFMAIFAFWCIQNKKYNSIGWHTVVSDDAKWRFPLVFV